MGSRLPISTEFAGLRVVDRAMLALGLSLEKVVGPFRRRRARRLPLTADMPPAPCRPLDIISEAVATGSYRCGGRTGLNKI